MKTVTMKMVYGKSATAEAIVRLTPKQFVVIATTVTVNGNEKIYFRPSEQRPWRYWRRNGLPVGFNPRVWGRDWAFATGEVERVNANKAQLHSVE